MKKVAIILLMLTLMLVPLFAQGAKAREEVDQLILYSGAAEDEAEALTKLFNEKYPNITVSIHRAGSGELVRRIFAEQPRPQGDILLMVSKESMESAYNCLRAYKSVNHDMIDISVRDSADTPRFYGSSMPLQAIMVNTDLLGKHNRPKAWKDLIDPKYKGKIILADPSRSGSAYAQLYMLSKLYGMSFMAELAQNCDFTASSIAGPRSVARGEYAITITGESNIAKYIKEGAPVTYVYPAEGTGARFDATAIIANGPNPRAAELFMDFITSVEAYEVIRTTRNRRVVSTELPRPAYLPALSEITLFPYDDMEAKNLYEELIEEFSSLMH